MITGTEGLGRRKTTGQIRCEPVTRRSCRPPLKVKFNSFALLASICMGVTHRGRERGAGGTRAVDAGAAAMSMCRLSEVTPCVQQAVCGLRVRLSESCMGSGIKGEKGCGTIQWVGNDGKVCHVRWDENQAFDYSYCIGHNGFYDLQAVQGEALHFTPIVHYLRRSKVCQRRVGKSIVLAAMVVKMI
eukprot:757408-Hanusia_phi.AAC.2